MTSVGLMRENLRASGSGSADGPRPLCIDLFCGLGGWAEGFLAEGYDVIGFDIERHDYGTGGYPGQLVLQDVLTLDGRQFRNAAVIVASPPCQAYSYRAMPWKRAKALPPPDNTLFEACFRIQREASLATVRDCPACYGLGPRHSTEPCARCAGVGWLAHGVPLVVENVKGAQLWVGRAKWHYGSYYLWGDVPALMPSTAQLKQPGRNFHFPEKYGIPSPSFHGAAHETSVQRGEAIKNNGGSWFKQEGSGPIWFDTGIAKHSSRSDSRKAASAQIAKIPFPLAQWIAKCYHP